MLAGLGWGSPDPELVESALEPHVPLPGGHRGYRVVDEARIRPRLSDLGVEDPRDLDAALVAWHRVALRAWAYESWLAVESLQPIRARLEAVQRRLRERGRRLSLDDTWKLVNAPVDEDNLELLSTLALAIAGDRVARPHLNFLLDSGAAPRRVARGRRAGRARGEHPPLVRAPVPRASEASRSSARLRSRRPPPSASSRASGVEVESPTLGRCRSCGRSARRGSRSATAAPGSPRGRDMNRR